MKIVVVSDSHKEFHKLNSVIENNLDADAFIHLGDGEHEFNDVRNLHPDKSFLSVFLEHSAFSLTANKRITTR